MSIKIFSPGTSPLAPTIPSGFQEFLVEKIDGKCKEVLGPTDGCKDGSGGAGSLVDVFSSTYTERASPSERSSECGKVKNFHHPLESVCWYGVDGPSDPLR